MCSLTVNQTYYMASESEALSQSLRPFVSDQMQFPLIIWFFFRIKSSNHAYLVYQKLSLQFIIVQGLNIANPE